MEYKLNCEEAAALCEPRIKNVSRKAKGVYANILLDFWFKRTFVDLPDSKRLLQLFLQEVIPERKIVSINYISQEHTNPDQDKKGIRVDVEVTDQDGVRFVVEMQRSRQENFYDRALYYASHCIIKQMDVGDKDYNYPAVYFIGLVDFKMHEDPDRVMYRYAIKEVNDGDDMTDKINYIFLELPNCGKALGPEATVLDNFCYSLHNLEFLEDRPEELRQEIFLLLFEAADISKLTPEEKTKYDYNMTTERDIQNQIAYAEKVGRREGREEEALAIARKMVELGYSAEEISKVTGVSEKKIPGRGRG